jgi:hypothetical protein
MPLPETLGLLLAALAAWLWADTLKAREVAIRAARAACEAEGLLLLDDTVVAHSLWPARNGQGQLRPRRAYAFEYSETGNDRRKASMILIGHEVMVVSLGLRREDGARQDDPEREPR